MQWALCYDVGGGGGTAGLGSGLDIWLSVTCCGRADGDSLSGRAETYFAAQGLVALFVVVVECGESTNSRVVPSTNYRDLPVREVHQNWA